MFIKKYWDILVVDDEPDVLAVTRLALKGMRVFGIPLRLHECASKADAIAFFDAQKREGARYPHIDVALAMVDVVMETEHSGLELCGHVRQVLKNSEIQLVVRTGQAGLAPERAVTDRNGINAYVSKNEATEDQLYSVVKNSVRDYFMSRVTFDLLRAFDPLTRCGSRDEIRKVLGGLAHEVAMIDGMEANMAVFIDNVAVNGFGECADPKRAGELKRELAGAESQTVTESGDTLRRRGDKISLSLAPEAGFPSVESVAVTNFDPMPDFYLPVWAHLMRGARNLWKRLA